MLHADEHAAGGLVAPVLLQVVLVVVDELVVRGRAGTTQWRAERPRALVRVLVALPIEPGTALRVGNGLVVLVASDVDRGIGIVAVRPNARVAAGVGGVGLVGVEEDAGSRARP